jgi:predicted nucleic acid-binding protein
MAAAVSAGGLYALLDSADRAHDAAVAALDGIEGPLLLITPVLAEAMRLAERSLGREPALLLLESALKGEIMVQPSDKRDLAGAARLLRAYPGLGLGAALTLALARRLGAVALLCLEPALRQAVAQEGLLVLPGDESLGHEGQS